MKKTTLSAALLGSFLLAGCGVESDIKTAIKKKHEKEICFFVAGRLPAHPWPHDAAWMDKLADADIMVKHEVTDKRRAAMMGTSHEYDLSSKGRKMMNDKNELCYGKARLVEIVDYTEPQNNNGVEMIRAQATMKYEITESWAKDPAFKDKVKSGEANINETLVKMAKQGWVAR